MSKRKNDKVVQPWMDSRYLATGMKYLKDCGINASSMGEVVRIVFNSAVDNLIESGKVQLFSSTKSAQDYIEKETGNKFNPGNKAVRNLVMNLEKDRDDKGIDEEILKGISDFNKGEKPL